MKHTLFALLATTFAFASNVHVNTKENGQEKTRRHWIYSLGATAHSSDPFYPTIELGFGYQSKYEENRYFQSQRIEVMGGTSLDGNNITWAAPKFSALHYFNPQENRRFFYLVGASVHGYTYELDKPIEIQHKHSYIDTRGEETVHHYTTEEKFSDQVSIAACVGIGMEIGEHFGTINNFQITVDQPTLFFGKKKDDNSFKPFLKATYLVGF